MVAEQLELGVTRLPRKGLGGGDQCVELGVVSRRHCRHFAGCRYAHEWSGLLFRLDTLKVWNRIGKRFRRIGIYERYLGWLQDMAAAEGADPCDPDTSGCLFAAAPDVVADAAATLRRESVMRMLGWIRYAGLPVAFVLQDGQESLPVPWDDFDAAFIGGSTSWKLGPAARALAAQARARGKWVHMGRVNSLRRLRYAAAIRCDSADGTFLARGPDVNLPKVLGWLRDVNQQGALWTEPAWTEAAA